MPYPAYTDFYIIARPTASEIDLFLSVFGCREGEEIGKL